MPKLNSAIPRPPPQPPERRSARLLWTPLVAAIALTASSRNARAQETEPQVVEETAPASNTAAPVAVEPTPVAVPVVITSDSSPLPIEFHGYASQAFVISDHNNYYQSNSNRGTGRLTDVALNASTQVTDKLRFVMQVAAVINDASPGPGLRLDFGFADYHLSDYLGFRVGRYRLLNALYSEVWDTDIARVPIFLPSSVYDPSGRQLFLSGNGIELYGQAPFGAAGTLNYILEVGVLDNFTLDGIAEEIKWMGNARVIYETPIQGLRVGGSFMKVGSAASSALDPGVAAQVIAAGLAPPTFDGTIDYLSHDLFVAKAFAELAIAKLVVAAEYQHTHTDLVSSTPLIGPNQRVREDGFYALASYRWADWFTTGAYASFFYADYTNRSTAPANHQFDYAFTTRFDLNSYLSLKMEIHHIDGIAQLIPSLNAEGPQANSGWLFATRVSAAF